MKTKKINWAVVFEYWAVFSNIKLNKNPVHSEMNGIEYLAEKLILFQLSDTHFIEPET